MLRKYSFAILIALIFIVICAWSPWLSQASAEARAVDSFNTSWQSLADGCGTNCKGCGVISSQRVPFGVLVKVEFACGLIPADSQDYHRQATAFVSALGTVHGLPKP